MAVSCPFSLHNPLQKPVQIAWPVNRIVVLKQSSVPIKKAPTLLVRSSFQNKVFEDRSEGIVCYRDDNGEIICEGFDEGPRYHDQIQRTAYNTRDVEVINLLQESWPQIFNGGDLKNADKGVVALQEDFNGNGFNRFF